VPTDHDLLLDGWRYCPRCASPLEFADIGELPRPRCPECGYRYFRNPGVGAAAVVLDGDGRVLLVRRSDNGLWCVPCGFCEWGEDIRMAAARECREESGIEVEVGDVLQVMSNFHDAGKPTIGVWFWAEAVGGTLMAGDDAVDAGYFDLDDLPPLAFPTDVTLFERLRATRA
jgi:ADP-ribose pyrophosphatase YjhB (NUDIX family)